MAGAAALTPAERLIDAPSVVLPCLIVAGVRAVPAIVTARFPLPAMGAATSRSAKHARRSQARWTRRNLVSAS